MIHFVAFDPATGEILRFGVCTADDLAIHGDHVLAFESAPGISDATHCVNPATRTLIQKD